MAEESPLMLVQPAGSTSAPYATSPRSTATHHDLDQAAPSSPSAATAIEAKPAQAIDRVLQSYPPSAGAASTSPLDDSEKHDGMASSGRGEPDLPATKEQSLASDSEKAVVTDATSDDLPALDTSWQAWLVVAGSSLSLLATFGATNAFGAYVSYYTVAYPNSSPSIISLIGGVQVGTLFFCGPVIGVLYDRIGPTPILIFGTLMTTFAQLMLSLTNAIWQVFLLQGVLYGIGIAAFFITAVALLPNWFVRRRAAAIGVAVAGGSLGGVIWPVFVRKVTEQSGFPNMCRYSGVIVFGCLVFGTLTMRQRTTPPGKRRLLPDFALLKRPAFFTFFLSVAFGYFGLFGVVFFISQRAINVGVDPAFAIYLTSILNTGSVFGRILPGILADMFGPINTVISALVLSVLFIAVAWIPFASKSSLIACALFYGYSSGSWVSICPACVPRIAGGIQNLGGSMGLIYLSSVPGALAGASIGSAVINTTTGTGYQAAGGIWVAFTSASLFFALVTRYLVSKEVFIKV